jgi:RNA polymerase sigma-70 factor (ECF subfamily)
MGDRTQKNCCDEKEFKELFLKHSRDLFQFLYYKYGADNNPGDIVQEAFLKLWHNCHKILPEKARSFVFTVANNQMLNELSRKKTVLKYNKEKSKQDFVETPGLI